MNAGTNIALAMGIPPEEIGVWDYADAPDPASSPIAVSSSGRYCYVHTTMTAEDVARASTLSRGDRCGTPSAPRVVALADQAARRAPSSRPSRRRLATIGGHRWHR